MAKPLEKPASHVAYDDDYYAWTQQQAELLRTRHDSELDFQHIADELEVIGIGEKRQIAAQLTALLHHLLLWEHQPAGRSNRLRKSILVARGAIGDIVQASPA